jgi:hypothetical protein
VPARAATGGEYADVTGARMAAAVAEWRTGARRARPFAVLEARGGARSSSRGSGPLPHGFTHRLYRSRAQVSAVRARELVETRGPLVQSREARKSPLRQLRDRYVCAVAEVLSPS